MDSYFNNIVNLNHLVCKRPIHSFYHDKVHIKNEQDKSVLQSKLPFVPGGQVPSLWGKGSTSKENEKNHKSVQRLRLLRNISKKNGAIGRHKKWLREVQIKRQKMKEDRMDALNAIDTSKALLKENEARKRAQMRESVEQEIGIETTKNDVESELQEMSINKLNTDLNDATRNMTLRPAWSLTEEVTKHTTESFQLEEENDLLKFTEGLNFEEYYNDMELKVLMTQVKDRIRALEKEKKTHETKLEIILEVSFLILSSFSSFVQICSKFSSSTSAKWPKIRSWISITSQ